MLFPTFNYENKLLKSGFSRICGIDEVGKGPLAGPVVACAVIIDKNFIMESADIFEKIRDSKKLSPKQREKWHKILTENEKIRYGIGLISEKLIDRINILKATKLAMLEAVRKMKILPDFILIDGNFTLEQLDLNQKAVPKGDAKIISIAAASIIAKVTRDRLMIAYHKKYPNYSFDRHKGYGTKLHFEALKKHGPCPIHRRSFEPVKSLKSKSP